MHPQVYWGQTNVCCFIEMLATKTIAAHAPENPNSWGCAKMSASSCFSSTNMKTVKRRFRKCIGVDDMLMVTLIKHWYDNSYASVMFKTTMEYNHSLGSQFSNIWHYEPTFSVRLVWNYNIWCWFVVKLKQRSVSPCHSLSSHTLSTSTQLIPPIELLAAALTHTEPSLSDTTLAVKQRSQSECLIARLYYIYRPSHWPM